MRNPTHSETFRQTRALSAALQMRCGHDPIDPNATDSVRREQERACEMGEAFIHEPLYEIARQCLRIEDCPEPVSLLDQVRSAFSTATLSNVLTANANASLTAGFDETPSSTLGWTSEVDRNDFKVGDAVSISANKLSLLPRGEVAESAIATADSESYSIARFAKSFVISDQNMADDNISALISLPRALGIAAGELRSDLVYGILLANAALDSDNIALFEAATHANLDTASSALSASTLEAGIARVAKQQENGRDLNLRVTHLIVPSALKITAAQILHNAQLDDQENITLRSDSRLDNGVTNPITGASVSANSTQWFLAAGPNRTIEVGFLQGMNRRPVIREYMLQQGRWGIGFDVSHDIGAKALSHLGLYKAVGTA